MNKRSLIPLALALLLIACPSAPPPAPEPTPPAAEPKDGAAVTTPRNLSAEEYREVESAIQAAEDLDAARYAPEALAQARDGLARARQLDQEGKYEEARAALAQAREAALRAQNEARQGSIAAERRRLEEAHNALLGVNADKYAPQEYQALKARYDEALALIDQGDLAAVRERSQPLARDMAALRDRVEQRLQTVTRLRLDAKQAIDTAERNDAAIWAPQELDAANQAFLQGLSAQRQFNLTAAEDAFTQARYQAQIASQRVQGGSARQRAEALMETSRRAIERASRLTVIDDDNNIIRGQGWDSEEALRQRQRQRIPEEPQSRLLTPDLPAVLEEVNRVTYLTLAKEAWLKGVDEKERGNYAVAEDYFKEALRYVQLYESLAVDKFYTVRLIPERRDCLWRIAEYPEIYGDPLLWPMIWYRNRRLVQNPDLIFPGWQLVIPPR